MSLRHIYPWRVHPSHPFWGFDDDDFDTFPFSSMVPRWRRSALSNPFSDFERKLAASATGRQQVSSSKDVGHASDEKNFVYNFDLSGFEPKDIKVKTVGQKVVVEAESEENEHEEGCHSFCHRHYHRSLVLPQTVKPEEITSTLTDQGILRISAPLLAITQPKENVREIEVQREQPKEVGDAPMTDES